MMINKTVCALNMLIVLIQQSGCDDVLALIHGCFLTSCNDMRCSGLATINFEMKCLAAGEMKSGILYLTCVIFINVSSYDPV